MKIKTKKGGLSFFLHLFFNNRQVFCLLILLWITAFTLPLAATLLPMAALASSITPQKIIELTNQERSKYELALLTENIKLTNAAEQKAQDILAQQKFAHNFSDQRFSQWIKDAGYQYSIVGENLAINFISSEGLFNAWLASPTHKQNILHDDYQEIGVAVMQGNFADENTIIAVELFAAPAVAAGQIASTNTSSAGTNMPALASAYYSASNLAENYITNIVNSELVESYPSLEQIELTTLTANKNEIIKYLSLVLKFVTVYIASMLLITLIIYYAIYFQNLIKKLGTIPYPIQRRSKESFTFSQKFMVKLE